MVDVDIVNTAIENAMLAHFGDQHRLSDVVQMYHGMGRHYHNWSHVLYVAAGMIGHVRESELIVAAVYHDAVYDVMCDDNEINSAILYGDHCKLADIEPLPFVNAAIMYTASTEVPDRNDSASVLWYRDNSVTYSTDFGELLIWEQKISREFSVYPRHTYLRGRIEFLNGILERNELIARLINLLQSELNYFQ